MNIEIKYCNNIENGKIEIKENILNIKYAINGTGKTSIAKAIQYKVENKDINELKPFKYKNDMDINSEVLGAENIKTIRVFNEEYVNQYVFLEDELIKNSFEIFIRNEEYDKGMEEINSLLKEIKESFVKDEQLENLRINLKTLSDCFGKSKTGYSAAGILGKGLGNGNKIENIPEELEDYSEYIRNDLNSKWLKWQLGGKDYLDITNKCPYCASKDIDERMDRIIKLGEEYDSKTIEHLNKILEVFESLNRFFSNEVKEKIKEITTNIKGITTEQKSFLLGVKNQVDTVISKLETIKNMGFITLKDNDKIVEIIKSYKIDMSYLHYLNSEETTKEVNQINKELDKVLERAGKLQGEINRQRNYIVKTIEEYDREINEFLKSAGINYNVHIELDEDNIYRMKFRHNEYSEKIQKPTLFLSYGEKNAFSLVLFMYEAIKSNPDLIILDDPISSFDKNKKFAIINMLFRGKNSLNNKTVILLTHDFEPIIDLKYVLPDRFEAKANFLENKEGVLKEKEISKKDIHTFLEIAEENIKKLSENVNKLIYIRRYYEIKEKNSLVYELTSNLFHKRNIPIIKEQEREMTHEEIRSATECIREKFIPDFNYDVELNKIINNEYMINVYNSSQNNYEKLQVYRIINEEKEEEDNILKKFVNETFHIENDYLFQVNPCEYEIIPNYIIKKCDENIKNMN